MRPSRKLLAVEGVAGLAFILVALIVLWSGYIQRVSWTWYVMFVSVWLYIFPAHILPVLRMIWRFDINHFRSLWDAAQHSGPARDVLKPILCFLVMVFALFLPVRSLLRKRPLLQADRV